MKRICIYDEGTFTFATPPDLASRDSALPSVFWFFLLGHLTCLITLFTGTVGGYDHRPIPDECSEHPWLFGQDKKDVSYLLQLDSFQAGNTIRKQILRAPTSPVRVRVCRFRLYDAMPMHAVNTTNPCAFERWRAIVTLCPC